MIGVVAVWNSERGFGFADVEGATAPKRVFVHLKDVEGLTSSIDHPAVGDVLEFDVVDAGRGPRAVAARRIRRAAVGIPGR